jgi:sugar/nucleoside kinase (ribokinase family)
MMHVICVGDVMIDVVAKLPGPLAIGSDTPAAIGIHGGGAAANVAAWLVEAGASATFFGRIGDDPFGLRAVEELSNAGVEPLVTIDPTLPTGTCIVLVNERGERTMVPCAGANDAPSDPTLLPARADWLYLSGYSLLSRGSRPFALEVLDVARERGWSIAVDAASSSPLRAVGGSTFLDWLGEDVLLFANTDEALVLTELDDPAVAAKTLAARCGQAIVKRGVDGAVWSDGDDTQAVPAKLTRVVDSTGAGDAFAAGFLAGTGDVAESLASAVELAARAVSRVGARPGIR